MFGEKSIVFPFGGWRLFVKLDLMIYEHVRREVPQTHGKCVWQLSLAQAQSNNHQVLPFFIDALLQQTSFPLESERRRRSWKSNICQLEHFHSASLSLSPSIPLSPSLCFCLFLMSVSVSFCFYIVAPTERVIEVYRPRSLSLCL